MPPMAERYIHGHHPSVLQGHRWRTAENAAAYLLPNLATRASVLDVGCGPGTITRDFATLVAPGRVVGMDRSQEIVAAAAAEFSDRANLEFVAGDVYELPFPSGTFDIVHAHQVLQHLEQPVTALREMARVCRPGGLVAVRDVDYASLIWSPADPLLDRWLALYHEVALRAAGEPDAGRHLPEWFARAGLEDVAVTSSTWTFTDLETRQWWGSSWAGRARESDFAHQAIDAGLSTATELDGIAQAWRSWADAPVGLLAMIHVEVIATIH